MSSRNLSVLNSRSCGDVRRDPFDHIVCDSPVSPSFYDRLAQTFPPDDLFFRHLPAVGSNQAVRVPASSVIGNDMFCAEWREFFEYHVSDAFWRDIVRVFGRSLRETYPDLEQRIGRPMQDWRTRIRGRPGNGEIKLDLLFVINTPVRRAGSVRPAHVDRCNKIFSGLFYMKQKDDPTPGGDLALYSFKTGRGRFGGHYANLDHLNEEARISYRSNRFIGFVNSQLSIHGVTPRPKTEWTRRYINFVAELPFDAFTVPKLPLHQRWKSALTRRMARKLPGVTLSLDR